MQLTVAQRKQATAAAREWDLLDKNAQLERQLGNRSEQASASNSLSDVTESLRAELRARKEQLATTEQRLATALTACDEQSRGRQNLAAENQTLSVQHEALAVKFAQLHEEYEALKTSYDVLSTMQPDETSTGLEQRLQTAETRFTEFVQQRDFMFQTAEENYRKIQESLRLSESRESALRQELEESNTLETREKDLAEAQQAAESAKRFHALASENARRLTQEIGQAKEDAVKSCREMEGLKITIEDLEGRLANNSLSQSTSSQEIPKRQTGDLGSIRHALEESQATVSKQQPEIEDLKRKLALASQPSPQPEVALREEITKLREALKSEKRARDEDRITWSKENRDLREENQRLQVARSNAGAVARGGAMRKPTRP